MAGEHIPSDDLSDSNPGPWPPLLSSPFSVGGNMACEHEIRITPIHSNSNDAIDGTLDVSLVGEFDLSTAPELHERLLGPEVHDARGVRVDLSAVSFIDSSTISLIVAACKRVRSAGRTFSVICTDGPALKVLETLGLVDYFEVRVSV